MESEAKKEVVNNDINKITNSLMKKTKVQLVDIILRKDKIEQNLHKDCEGMKKQLKIKTLNSENLGKERDTLNAKVNELYAENKSLKKNLEEKSRKMAILENDYHEQCDRNQTMKIEYKDKITVYKFYFFIAVVIAILECIALFVVNVL